MNYFTQDAPRLKSAQRIRYLAMGFAIAFVLDLLNPNAVHADYPSMSHMTLSGIGAVAVEISGVPKDFIRFGLDRDTINRRTAQTLENHGLEIVDLNAAKQRADSALMHIKLHANQSQYQFYMYGLSIEMTQKIPLHNAAGGFISGTIWEQGTSGVIMPTDLQQLNERIAVLVNKFLTDHRAQNPERVSTLHRQ